LLGTAALVIAGFMSFAALRRGPGPAPDPSLFILPTVPPAVPAAVPRPPMKPGAAAFEAGRTLLAQGDVAGALSLLSEAAAAAPNEELYRFTHGRALLLSG
jgi:hypothetical protein